MNENLKRLQDKHILVVEDEYLVADETRRLLEKWGAVVVGPVSNVSDGIELVNTGTVHAAILDIRLDGELVFPLADLLDERAIPFVFATGYDATMLPERYSGYILCEKPAQLEVIAKALFASGSGHH